MLALVVWSSSCSSGGTAQIEEATVSSDGLRLELAVGSCNAEELSAEVEETNARVVVTVTARDWTQEDCLDGLELRLGRPLAGRALIDGATGEAVPVNER